MRSPAAKGLFFHTNPVADQKYVQNRENHRDLDFAERQGHDRDLADNDQIIGVGREPIGTAAHKRFARRVVQNRPRLAMTQIRAAWRKRNATRNRTSTPPSAGANTTIATSHAACKATNKG